MDASAPQRLGRPAPPLRRLPSPTRGATLVPVSGASLCTQELQTSCCAECPRTPGTFGCAECWRRAWAHPRPDDTVNTQRQPDDDIRPRAAQRWSHARGRAYAPKDSSYMWLRRMRRNVAARKRAAVTMLAARLDAPACRRNGRLARNAQLGQTLETRSCTQEAQIHGVAENTSEFGGVSQRTRVRDTCAHAEWRPRS